MNEVMLAVGTRPEASNATNVGAFRDMLGPEYDECLVPPDDADALRAAFARFIDLPPDEVAAYRAHILERGVQHFSWDTIARQTLHVYQEDA